MKGLQYLVAGLMAGLTAGAAPIVLQSSERRVALLELYTSEGCSSCPPAELWLGHLKENPALWRDFVPVAFHVDYWDGRAWRDKWSDRQFSDRQRDYAKAWLSASIYTPGFVWNGKEWQGWYERKAMPSVPAAKAGVLGLRSDDGRLWQASFVPATTGGLRCVVHAVLLASGLNSAVKGGENAGRRLTHDFVALSLVDEPLSPRVEGFQGSFVLETKRKSPEGRLALAAWVTRAGHLEPAQAVGAWLPNSMKN